MSLILVRVAMLLPLGKVFALWAQYIGNAQTPVASGVKT